MLVNSWCGFGKAGGFNHNGIELVPPLQEMKEGPHQIAADRATYAIIIHLHQIMIG